MPVCLQFPGLDHAVASFIPILFFSSRGQAFAATAMMFHRIWLFKPICEIERAADGNCSQSQDFMGIGNFLSPFAILCAQSAVLLPKRGFLSPIWLF